MDRYEIFDPETYHPYGTAATMDEAVDPAGARRAGLLGD